MMQFSSIGFGCYRIDYNIEDHYNALHKALTSGISLIDTSANYSDGRSETLIGRVINDLISEGKIKRENLTIVTKAGYIQGQNFKNASQLKSEGKGFKEVVELSDRLWHSINPGFIEDQIGRQLKRLNQNYVDVYLLHNPEYYLEWAKINGVQLSDAREIYYERIRRAFEFLEEKVKEGKIKYYGISSNTFPVYSNQYEFTSLEKIIDIANSISEKNYFKVIQLPFNLIETGALTIKNQINDTVTVLELAEKTGIKVLVNRPLNAITSKGLVRLADFHPEPFQEKDFIKQMKLVSMMEDELLNDKIPEENLNNDTKDILKKNLTFGNTIEKDWKFFGSIEHYNDVISQLFVPRIDFLINTFEKNISSVNTKDFFERYIKECYKLLNFVGNYYKLRADRRSKIIHELINKKLDENFHNLTLSQKTILLLKSVDGVSCILVGMRKEKYVDDVLKIPNEKIFNSREIIESLLLSDS